MTDLTIKVRMRRPYPQPATSRDRVLSHTRIADVKKAVLLGKEAMGVNHPNEALLYLEWAVNALYQRRSGV